MALYVGKYSAPSGRVSFTVLAINPECIVFAVGLTIFYVYDFYCNPGHDGSLYDSLLDSRSRIQSVDDKAVFVSVGDVNAHHSEWLESVSPTDQHGCDALNFCNLSGCGQSVRCPTHIASNRLDLVMTDAPDAHSRCVRWYSTAHT